MINHSCLVCKQQTVKSYYAILAPWIRELCSFEEKPSIYFLKCLSCGFGNFSHRYSDLEMAAIYTGYRGPRYIMVRRRWEPWYSKSDANSYMAGNAAVSQRNIFMKSAFQKAGIELGEINSVLDFGGDLGQFIPDEISGPKYLIDPSQISMTTSNGVSRVGSINRIPEKLDLIMNCHTLEHLSDFTNVIDEINTATKIGGLFYLEVPLDGFGVTKFHKTFLYDHLLKIYQKSKHLLILMNFLTGVYRQLFSKIPSFGIIQQSEHINYFGQKSLQILLQNSGYKILVIQGPDFDIRQGKIRLGRIGILSRKF